MAKILHAATAARSTGAAAAATGCSQLDYMSLSLIIERILKGMDVLNSQLEPCFSADISQDL